MTKRLLITLISIIALYNIPAWAVAHGQWYWLDCIVCSLLLIAFLSSTQLRYRRKINTISAVVLSIILIECFAICVDFAAWYGFVAHKSQWFYDNFERIMTACYYVELTIIITSMAIGSYTRINSLCITFANRFKAVSNFLLYWVGHLCKSTQAI